MKVIFCGDFRQVLPVKDFASPSQIVAGCYKYSNILDHMHTFRLKQNMRTAVLTWSQFLPRVANEKETQKTI